MNPNGLTDEEIASRPKLEEVIGYNAENNRWFRCRGDSYFMYFGESSVLLPGETGCPWPPPDEFIHEWKDGDRAWILLGEFWEPHKVRGDSFWNDYRDEAYEIDIPAIYIPGRADD